MLLPCALPLVPWEAHRALLVCLSIPAPNRTLDVEKQTQNGAWGCAGGLGATEGLAVPPQRPFWGPQILGGHCAHRDTALALHGMLDMDFRCFPVLCL